MWIRLGELTNYGNNEAIQTKDIPDDSKIIELDNIEKNTGKIISNSKKSNNLESTRHIFRKGCILYSKLRPYLNKVAIPEFDGYCSTEIMTLYPNYEIDLNYLHLVLRSPYFVEYAMSKVYGTKMPRLGTSDGKNALIPLAPLNEQQKIVGFVIKSDYLFEECQNLNSILVRLDKDIRSVLTESILQTAIQGKLVPQDPNDKPVQIQCKNPIIIRDNSYYEIVDNKEVCIDGEVTFDVPSGWMICRQGDVLEFINGKSYDVNEVVPDGKYKLVRVGNLFTSDQWLYTNIEHEEKQYCENGDLLFGWSMSIGPYIWDGGKSVYVQHIWKIIHHPYFDTKYLYYLLLAEVNELKSIKHGSSMQHITLKMMKHRICCIPPMNEQKRIVEKIELLQSSLGHLDDLH